MNVFLRLGLLSLLIVHVSFADGRENISIASYNLDNYRIQDASKRRFRSKESRAEVARSILNMRPQIVGLQELGSRAALEELRSELSLRGLRYDHLAFLDAIDQEIHCGLLSQHPVVEDRSDAGVEFVLYGRVFRVLRGVLDVKIQPSPTESIRVLNVHLKSKLSTWFADQADYRLAEAVALRDRIDRILSTTPNAKLAVLGDFNDNPGSLAVRTVIGRGRQRLFDLRPVEQVADGGRGVSWTHYYEKIDAYFRYDFLLVSQSLKECFQPQSAVVSEFRNWSAASDHRLIKASFAF